MALLFCASKVKGGKIRCLHLTHDIRPKNDTDNDLRVVKALCTRLNIPLKHEEIFPQEKVDETGGNLEDAASYIRHLHYQAACVDSRYFGSDDEKQRCVATAHHADDQLETILMKIGRGCGLRGLSGIAPYYYESGMTLIRPMLCITKEDCIAICKDNNIEWSEDSTNGDTNLVRNRIRKEVLPVLKELFPEICQNATDAAGIVASAQEVVRRGSFDHMDHYQIHRGLACANGLRFLPIEAARLAEDIEIYEWIVRETRSIGGDAEHINKFMLDQVIYAIRDKKSRKFNWVSGNTLRLGTIVETTSDKLIVRHMREEDKAKP